jgi:hypothetical protein
LYLVPAGIGIKPPDCIYWLHTHDISGIIHVESPDNRTFTLGQFFDIWGKKFNNSQIFDFMVDKSANKTLLYISMELKQQICNTEISQLLIMRILQ